MFDELADDDFDPLDHDALKLQTLQSILLDLVQSSSPDLVEFARQKITWITNPDMLRVLTLHIARAADEIAVRMLLNIIPINIGQHLFDKLLDEDPDLLERDIRNAQRVVQETKLRILHSTITSIIQRRFPNLVEFALPKVAQITNIEKLQILMDQIVAAPDENFTRILLDISAAS